MSDERIDALLVTPLPPIQSGLATYALRVLENTSDFVDWTVAYTDGSDPLSLPAGIRSMPVEELEEDRLPDARIFQIGNSPDCFPVVQALYRYGGTALFHELVLHHMLRYSYLDSNRMEDYRRELVFCYGPVAESVEKDLADGNIPLNEYDRKLKRYPLTGRALHASHSAVCLNSYAASILKRSYPEGRVISIGHPLSPLPQMDILAKPFSLCFGMVGTNHPGRNLECLIEAVALLRDDFPDAGLILIGGNYPESLPEWVRRTGRLDEKEYQGWIRTLDYVFDVRHPACGETSGSLLEAMRAGIPSIVTASGTFINLPSDAVIRVPVDNIVQGIRSAVILLEARPELRNSLSNKAASYAEDTGCEERLAGDWKRVLSLAGKPPEDDYRAIAGNSISPAWHESPAGFKRDLDTLPVTWTFSGTAEMEAPLDASGATLTAWGEGTVNGCALSSEPSIITVTGREIHFCGRGWISNVIWK